MSNIRRTMMAAGRRGGSAVDWESIARGMVDFTTPFSVPAELVTTIPNQAYNGRVGLQAIEIPDTITTIGTAAFIGCKNLQHITLPNALTELKSQLFYNCSNLSNVVVPNSVTTIGSSAFGGCNRLSKIDIGTGITSIGGQCFYHNYPLTMIIRATTPPSLGSNNTSLGNASSTIYVPDESVAAYKAASDWSAYAAKIYPISEYTE